MIPPSEALRPHVHRITDPVDGGVVSVTTVDALGSLDGLKSHVAVEHNDDDVYLREVLAVAQQMVGDYTRWPMHTGVMMVEARWWWPLPPVRREGTRVYWYDQQLRRPLLIPGPVSAMADVIITGDVTVYTVDPSARLPNDGVLYLSPDFISTFDDSGTGELVITYPMSWSSIYPDAPSWPVTVVHTIYRVAATLYLYREATMPGDRPLHRIMQAALGPYLPVLL